MGFERDVFSDQSFAIQIRVTRRKDGSPVVGHVLIGGRPAGLFGLASKSHLVPWLAMCDGLRADIEGQTLRDALNRVLLLCQWARNLPSQTLAGALRGMPDRDLVREGQAREKEEEEEGEEGYEDAETGRRVAATPRWWHAAADRHMSAVCQAAADHLKTTTADHADEDLELLLLQNLAAGYLHYRNTAPLTAAAMPRPNGPLIAVARDIHLCETTLAAGKPLPIEPKAVCEALWRLLDHDALRYLRENPTELLDRTVDLRKVDVFSHVIADHVRSMEHAYPLTTAAANFRAALSRWLDRSGVQVVEGLLEYGDAVPPPAAAERLNGPEHRLAEDTESETADVYERFAVQFDLAAGRDGQRQICRVYLGSRPPSRKGRHVTAWVALCDYARAAVDGQTLDNVVTRISALQGEIARIRAVIAAEASVSGPPRKKRRKEEPEKGGPEKGESDVGESDVGGPDAGGPDAGSAVTLESVQVSVADFLMGLNELEDSIVDTGGTSPGATEYACRAALLCGKGGISDIAGLFDPECLKFMSASWESQRHAFRVALHLHLVSAAYLGGDIPLSAEMLAELVAPTELMQEIAHEVNELVLAALAGPGADYDRAAYVEAADQYRRVHSRTVAAKKRTNEDADFRISQASDGSQASGGSQNADEEEEESADQSPSQ